MEKIKYRTAELKDLPTLLEFEQGIVSTERPFDPTLKSGAINYYDLAALIKDDNAEVLVAQVNNLIVGSAYVKIKKAQDYLQFDQYAYLGFMFVRPEYRRKGISQNIISRLKSWAQLRGLEELRLDVYDDNHIAMAAYENIGFKRHLVEMRIKL